MRPGHGTPSTDLAALKGMLLRVSRIADDLPQIGGFVGIQMMTGQGRR